MKQTKVPVLMSAASDPAEHCTGACGLGIHLVPHWCTKAILPMGDMPIWVLCIATRGHDDILA